MGKKRGDATEMFWRCQMEPFAPWRRRRTWPEPQLTPWLLEVWWLSRNSKVISRDHTSTILMVHLVSFPRCLWACSSGLTPVSTDIYSFPSPSSVLEEFIQAAYGCWDGSHHNLLPSSPYMFLLSTFSLRSTCCTPTLFLYIPLGRVSAPFPVKS